MIVGSIDVIIQAARLRDGSRRITHVTEVLGLEGEVVVTQDLFVYEMTGEDKDGRCSAATARPASRARASGTAPATTAWSASWPTRWTRRSSAAMDMTTLVIAVLGSSWVGGLGSLRGGESASSQGDQARADLRVQTGSRIDRKSPRATTPPSAQADLGQLKEAERRQRKAHVSSAPKLQQAGLSMKPLQLLDR
jgi:hypothetical protein